MLPACFVHIDVSFDRTVAVADRLSFEKTRKKEKHAFSKKKKHLASDDDGIMRDDGSGVSAAGRESHELEPRVCARYFKVFSFFWRQIWVPDACLGLIEPGSVS